jgi:hypothetical protein
VIVEDDRIRELVPVERTPFELAVARALTESQNAEASPLSALPGVSP